MSFLSSLNINATGMTAQRLRLDVASENIVNSEVTRTADGTPYRKKMVVLRSREDFRSTLDKAMNKAVGSGVVAEAIVQDNTDFKMVYNPNHPDADAQGYVRMPNVNVVQETTDAMAATHSYEANITAYNAVKQMATKALEIGK